jgi:hypothetical protein
MESKIGTVIAESQRLISSRTTLDTANEFCIKTSPRKKWYFGRFNELLLLISNDLSDRKTVLLPDKIIDQDKGVTPTTVRNHLDKEWGRHSC